MFVNHSAVIIIIINYEEINKPVVELGLKKVCAPLQPFPRSFMVDKIT